LKDETIHAYKECQAFNDHIKEQQKHVEVFLNDCITKYPNHEQYFQALAQTDNIKTAEKELSMLNDAVKCMQMKIELMTDNVKENGTLLSVLHAALTE
jgi:adenosyl cobinamide kinase/adenosyl cobinamide phosphate guanylyltransferase